MRGYYRRSANTWSAARWSTYHIMSAFAGGDAMKKNGIYTPKDLLPLPWDEDDIEPQEPMSEEDVKALQADIDRANAEGTPW